MQGKNLTTQTRNLISAKIHELAAKSSDPSEKLEQCRKTICMELGISPKQLTFWEQNTTQPHIHQITLIMNLLRQWDFNGNITYNDLIISQ